MVYAVAYCPLSQMPRLKEAKYDDSKKLTEQERDGMFEGIRESHGWLGYAVTALSARDISRRMLRRTKYNLNLLSFDTAIGLVRQVLARGVNVKELYVDTVGSPQKYQLLLRQTFPSIGKIVVESKADANYPIVSAASICAKVTRDQLLRDWQFEEQGFESQGALGSGYPSDPTTKQWLQANVDPIFGFPSLIRFSWSTSRTIVEAQCVAFKWPYGDDEDGDDAK